MKTLPLFTFLALSSAAIADPTPAFQLDIGILNRTSSTVKGPAHAANGGPIVDSATRWNAVGAAKEYTAVQDVAPGTIVAADGTLLESVGVDFGRSSSSNTWIPDYAGAPTVRNPPQKGVYDNDVLKDIVCFDGGGYNTTFVRVYGLNPGRYAVYSMHRNGFQSYTMEQNACAVAGDATTSLADFPKVALRFRSDADTAAWNLGANFAFHVVEITETAPDLIVGCNSTQNNQRGVINAIQVAPLPLEASFTATDTTQYAGDTWRTPCTVEVTASCAGATAYTWRWGEDPLASETTDTVMSTHTYTIPGTYTIQLLANDGNGQVGISTQTIVLTGNRAPTANAGADKVGYVGEVTELTATASTDPDAGDVLSYTWTQLSGPTVTLSNATSVSPTYIATEVGTYTFQVAVSDSGDPMFTDTATVTHTILERFSAAVMIDFGQRNSGNDSLEARTNTPAHADRMLGEADSNWFRWNPSVSDSGRLADVFSGVTDSQGNPVGLAIDLGQNNSLVPNYASQPFQRSGNITDNARTGRGLFRSNIFGDYLQADGSNRSFVRLIGFAPGRYQVFITARNTFQKGIKEHHYLRAVAGTATTQPVTAWTEEDSVGFDTEAEVTQLTWEEGINYRSIVVELTPENPDILVVSQLRDAQTDHKHGLINTIQVVPIRLTADFTSEADLGMRAPAMVAFDASTSVGTGLTYQWAWGDGTEDTIVDQPIVSHHYEYPGTYNVTLTVRDASGQMGVLMKSITFTGNHIPVADAGSRQVGILTSGLTLTLDATASTDADESDTLSYAWTQLEGPGVDLMDATTATPSYCPAEAGTYVFHVTVSDDGEPVRSSTAVVTNNVFSKTRAPVNLDFGLARYDLLPAPGSASATNAPAFVEGVAKPQNDTWFRPENSLETVGGIDSPVEDWMDTIIAADGTEISLLVDYGTSAPNTWIPDWNAKPRSRSGDGGMGSKGVYNTPASVDFIYGREEGHKVYLRISGYEPGRYRVYAASRNNYATRLKQGVRIGVGTADTVFDRPLEDEEILAEYTEETVQALSTEWVEGVTYIAKTVVVNSANPDILLVSAYLDGNENKGGIFNFIQIVPVDDPATLILVR